MRFFLVVLLLQITTAVFAQDNIAIATSTNDLQRYTIFMKGEFHDRRTENEPAFLHLAQYLYQHNNVRYLVFEWGPDFSYLANRYLQTQDDSILFNHTLEFSKAFWDTLVENNSAKAVADQIQIAGFDFNRSVFTGKVFFIMTRGKAPFQDPSIQSAIEEIIKWKDVKWTWEVQEQFVDQMKQLQSLCKKQQPALATYFGNDWPSFLAIISHDVDSKSVVTRDKKSINYVRRFLQTKGNGAVLFKLGISHTFLDGMGIGKMLNEDPLYRGQVCSFYPYYQLSPEEKTKIQLRKDSYLPASILSELESLPSYSLINLEQRGLYPKPVSIAQYVYVIPKVNR